MNKDYVGRFYQEEEDGKLTDLNNIRFQSVKPLGSIMYTIQTKVSVYSRYGRLITLAPDEIAILGSQGKLVCICKKDKIS